MKKYYYLLLGVAFATVFYYSGFSQNKDIPTGYYNNAEGLSGYDLKTALHDIIDDHNSTSYSALWTHMQSTDNDDVYENDNTVLDMYSENPSGADPYNYDWGEDQCGNYSGENSCYNREHSFPKSWFDDGYPMYTDLFHLYPTDGYVNGRRSNWPFGEVSSPDWTSQNGSKLGPCSYPGYSGTVFEPIDAFKGDFARTYFYMATRYQDVISNWSATVLDGSSDKVYVDWYLDMMLEWHSNDPVSQKEINRNNAVYAIQNNRNPFIDHPEYVTAIWGGNAATTFSNVTTNPAEPDNTDAVSVSATLSDTDGISSVILKWGTVSGSLNTTITMSNTAGNSYTSDDQIPAQADGTIVYYQIQVTDNLSVTASSDVYSYAIGEIPQEIVLLYENFETTEEDVVVELEGWLNYKQTGNVQWEGRFYGENRYAQMSSFQSDEENIVWLITPAINLDQSKNGDFSFDVNVAYWTHVGFSVKISNDFDGSNVLAANWEDVTSNFSIPTEPSSGYGVLSKAGSMSLHDYSGTVYIAFKYNGNDSGTSGETTTYQVDNVLIEGLEELGDNTAPVFTFSPDDEETAVLVSSAIVITASEPLLQASGEAIDVDYIQNVIDFKISNTSGADVSFTAAIDGSKKIITLTPSVNLLYETTYFIGIANQAFEDAAGNETTAEEMVFTTEEEPDTSAPLFTFNPEDGSENLDFDISITITSNESLFTNTASTVSANYLASVLSFNNEADQAVEFSASINENATVIVITPNDDLAAETIYELEIPANAFEDAAGNETETSGIVFSTKAIADESAPVLTFFPADGSENVDFDVLISITADEALLTNQGQDVSSDYITSVVVFKNEADEAVAYTASINETFTVITLTPNTGLSAETIYSISVLANAFEDAAGNETASQEIIFETRAIPDDTAPTFTFYPADGTENVDYDIEIMVTASEALLTNTGDAVTTEYIESVVALKNEADEAIAYTASINETFTLITLNPEAELAAETIYVLSIAAHAFEDTAGNETSAQEIIFETKPIPDETAPILTFLPNDGSENVEFDMSLSITANEELLANGGAALSTNYIESVLTFENESGTAVSYATTINENHTVITLIPVADLQAETIYKITLTAEAFEDTAGNTTAAEEILFKTKVAPDETAPVLTFSPQDGATDIELDAAVYIQSNELLLSNLGQELTASYVESVLSIQKINESGESTGDIAFDITISANQDLIEIEPSEQLTFSQRYRLLITEQAFEDTAGNETEAYSVNFTTKPEADIVAPVFSFNPENEATGVDFDAQMQVYSNEKLFTNNGEAVDNSYVLTAIELRLENQAGALVEFVASIDESNKEISIEAVSDLLPETNYYLVVLANTFEDEAGNENDLHAILFSTKPTPDTTAPTLTVYPVNDSVGVEINTSITLESNEFIFDATGQAISNNYVQQVVSLRKNSPEGALVDFSVSVNNLKKTIELTPYYYLDYSTHYYLMLEAGAFEDESGNETEALLSTFTSVEMPDNSAPEFVNESPYVENISTNAFNVVVQLNEGGKVYYKIQESTVAAPEMSVVLNHEFLEIGEAYINYTLPFNNLEANKNYTVYMLAQDTSENQNVSESFVTISAKTLGFAPEIVLQPESADFCENEDAFVFVQASGTNPISYQWFFNDVAISGANADTLHLSETTVENAGSYYCVLSNSWGSVTSAEAELTVNTLVDAGLNYAFVTYDTVTELVLFDYIAGLPMEGGYFTDNDNTGALNNGIFNPSLAGTGTYYFTYTISGPCNSDSSLLIVAVEKTVGVKNTTHDVLAVYPNPAFNTLHIDLQNYKNAQYQLYSFDGRLLKSEKLTRQQLDISDLQRGYYLLQIIADGVRLSTKFEKQ